MRQLRQLIVHTRPHRPGAIAVAMSVMLLLVIAAYAESPDSRQGDSGANSVTTQSSPPSLPPRGGIKGGEALVPPRGGIKGGDALGIITTEWSATQLYDESTSRDLMRADGSIVLNDHVLLENDAPGAGRSEKGPFMEPIHRGALARKRIELDDTRVAAAHVLLYLVPQKANSPAPYYIVLNGHRIEGIPKPWLDGVWHWVPIPVEHLVQGANVIELGCDAPQGEGYDLMFAREDEYARGGGTWTFEGNTALVTSGLVTPPREGAAPGFAPIRVGDTSDKSTDNGATWTTGRLGPNNDITGEYTIRLSVQRYHHEGTLVTPPIDLWHDPARGTRVTPQCAVESFTIAGAGTTPDATDLEWSVRFSNSDDPHDPAWGSFSVIGRGPMLDAETAAQGRYAQVRVRLLSNDPLATPSLHSLAVVRTVRESPTERGPIHIVAQDNPSLQYSSYPIAWQPMNEPALQTLRERLKLDELLADAHGDFERINLVRHHVSQLWYHQLPYPEYPEWNAHAVLDRNEKHGWGGMCMQFVVVFTQALQSLGYQARHVNLFNHESVEVYVNDLDRWVLVDPESVFDSYEFRTDTGLPMNAVEQHEVFLNRYGFSAANPIPWMSPEPWCNWPTRLVPDIQQPVAISTTTDWINDPDPDKRPPQHNLAGFVRVIPRNDFMSNPTPRPLNNGSTYWPWSGYLCWYDATTPRMLHYAMHTDRLADFYPTINRVAFTITDTGVPGEVRVDMITQTPDFATIEVRVDEGEWRDSGSQLTLTLRPNALTRVEMRTRNSLAVRGSLSFVELLWHYQEPFKPKPKASTG